MRTQGLLHEHDFNERIMAALRGMAPERAIRALQYLSHAVSAEQLSSALQRCLSPQVSYYMLQRPAMLQFVK